MLHLITLVSNSRTPTWLLFSVVWNYWGFWQISPEGGVWHIFPHTSQKGEGEKKHTLSRDFTPWSCVCTAEIVPVRRCWCFEGLVFPVIVVPAPVKNRWHFTREAKGRVEFTYRIVVPEVIIKEADNIDSAKFLHRGWNGFNSNKFWIYCWLIVVGCRFDSDPDLPVWCLHVIP